MREERGQEFVAGQIERQSQWTEKQVRGPRGPGGMPECRPPQVR